MSNPPLFGLAVIMAMAAMLIPGSIFIGERMSKRAKDDFIKNSTVKGDDFAADDGVFYVIVNDEWAARGRVSGLRAAKITARRYAELGKQAKVVKAMAEYEPQYAVRETEF